MEMLFFLILKQWRKDFPIVVLHNCKHISRKTSVNTKKSTGLKKKDTVQILLSYEAKELDEKLETFFAEVRKNDSSDYKPDS